MVYPTRSIDVGETPRYIELLTSERVRRIYLDELESVAQQSIGIRTVKLVIDPESSAGTKAKELINLVRQEIADDITIAGIYRIDRNNYCLQISRQKSRGDRANVGIKRS